MKQQNSRVIPFQPLMYLRNNVSVITLRRCKELTKNTKKILTNEIVFFDQMISLEQPMQKVYLPFPSKAAITRKNLR